MRISGTMKTLWHILYQKIDAPKLIVFNFSVFMCLWFCVCLCHDMIVILHSWVSQFDFFMSFRARLCFSNLTIFELNTKNSLLIIGVIPMQIWWRLFPMNTRNFSLTWFGSTKRSQAHFLSADNRCHSF